MQTKISNLFEPQLLADAVKAKLGDAIVFTPVAYTQDLQGHAGSTITLPKFEYIGDAVEVAEGQAIPIELLNQTSEDVKVVKFGKAVELTDEAVMNGYSDPIGETETQIVEAIKNGVEKAIVTAVKEATLTYDAVAVGKVNGDVYLEAMNLFGEDQTGEVFLYVHPSQLANVRKDAGYENGKLYEATVVPTNRVAVGEAFLMKAGAVGLYLKSTPTIEEDRDVLSKTTVIVADQHVAVNLRDASKVIRVNYTA